MSWIELLKKECDRTSQAKVAKQLGYSPAVINQVVKGTYKGDLNRVQIKVKATYGKEVVICPILGEIDKKKCLANQERPFAGTNPTRVALFKLCPTCENRSFQ